MITKLIEYSARNKFIILIFTFFAIAAGIWALWNTPLDAIPDLSDVQVIVYTEWAERSPTLIEDQVTYPIVTALLSTPYVKVVRGFSFFGVSFVYVIFEDGTDIYWARTRVLEYMQGVPGKLPPGVTPTLGPDATGVGWGFEYALVDTTGKYDLSQLRTLQDWYVRYWLQSVPGVAEVASIGGFVKQYQVHINPDTLNAYKMPIMTVADNIRKGNRDTGARVLEFTGREYMVRGRGYIQDIPDIENIVVGTDERGTPILVKNIGHVTLGPDIRRGSTELDGTGEVVGGIVVVRFGVNSYDVIQRVKEKIKEITPSLPQGVKIVTTYDRSDLIERSIATLKEKLIEESIIVSLVIILFLFHFRSALVPILTLPIAILLSFLAMYGIKLGSNIMSLGGIAIAIGAMVDAAIIMVENAHTRLEEWENAGKTHPPKRSPDPGGQRSGEAPVLLPADHHRLFPAHFHSAGAGGKALQAPGLHQDLRHVLRRFSLRDPGAGSHDPPDPGEDPAGGEEPPQPFPDLGLSTRSPFRPAVEKDHFGPGPPGHGGHGPGLPEARLGVHASPL